MEWCISKISDSLEKLKISKSYFYNKAKEILEDEEYIIGKDFCKCPFCDSDDNRIVNKDFEKSQIDVLISGLNYENPLIEEIKNYLNYMIQYHSKKSEILNLTICRDCRKILKVEDNFYLYNPIFKENDLFNLMVDEGILDKNGNAICCPCCNGDDFVEQDKYCENHMLVEYNLVCKKCGFHMYHFAYGNIYF